MATKQDFTPEEWQVLQWAANNTMAYLAMADPGFWDSFKEATGAAKYVADARVNASNLLVRDLASDIRTKRDKEATSNPTNLAGETAERVGEAAALVAQKDAGDSEAFAEFILGLAQATAQAANGVAEHEAEAIENLKQALGA